MLMCMGFLWGFKGAVKHSGVSPKLLNWVVDVDKYGNLMFHQGIS
jgi:hypothetical protein